MERKEIAKLALNHLYYQAKAVNDFQACHNDRFATDELISMIAVANFLSEISVTASWEGTDYPHPFRIHTVSVTCDQDELERKVN